MSKLVVTSRRVFAESPLGKRRGWRRTEECGELIFLLNSPPIRSNQNKTRNAPLVYKLLPVGGETLPNENILIYRQHRGLLRSLEHWVIGLNPLFSYHCWLFFVGRMRAFARSRRLQT